MGWKQVHEMETAPFPQEPCVEKTAPNENITLMAHWLVSAMGYVTTPVSHYSQGRP